MKKDQYNSDSNIFNKNKANSVNWPNFLKSSLSISLFKHQINIHLYRSAQYETKFLHDIIYRFKRLFKKKIKIYIVNNMKGHHPAVFRHLESFIWEDHGNTF